MQSIPEGSNFISLRDKLAVAGGELLVQVLQSMLAGTVRSTFEISEAFHSLTDAPGFAH